MKPKVLCLLSLTVLAGLTAPGATRYVNLNNPTPEFPYDEFPKAATVIQDAVDAGEPGDLILVTNGIYSDGGRAAGTNFLINRVVVDKPLTLRSFNGPRVTIIQGYQVPVYINGDSAVRCVYLASGAVLSGFTLTNGATGGAGESPDMCGGGVYCESTSAVVTNCVLTDNSAVFCGGAYGGTLNNCTLADNSAEGGGGGAWGATLKNCVLTNNVARDGGGAYRSTLNNCLLRANLAREAGGGTSQCTNYNCTLAENTAASGGGASGSTLYNCLVTGNSAWGGGGGASGCSLNNCTVTDNSAQVRCGGVFGGTLVNCIVYYNTAPVEPNYAGAAFTNCCTTPMPTTPMPYGGGNITEEPGLASVSHLSSISPCRGGGSAAYAVGTDIDGEAWLNPPSIGCDEYRTGAVTGPLLVSLQTEWTNVLTGFSLPFKALITGRTSASVWDFGDGVVVSNRPLASHAWAAAGEYLVMLRAYNESNPGGISATVAVKVVTGATHYVRLDSAAPSPPYNSWATAARSIQDAVDAAWVPGAVVLVSNGVYETGACAAAGWSNRVAVTKMLSLQSLNGPEVTIIKGHLVSDGENIASAIRCAYLTNGAVLSGFTLTNGGDPRWLYGGGVFCASTNEVLTNCVVTGNSAMQGGGAYSGTLHNCSLAGNSARFEGGGTANAVLYNCTLKGNVAESGGGACVSTLSNCTLAENTSRSRGGGASASILNDCRLTGNSASDGGGAFGCELNRCTLIGNRAVFYGGGAMGGFLVECTLATNLAKFGGGIAYGTLTRCIVKGNSAELNGGGICSTYFVQNCLITGNTANVGGGAYEATLANCTVTGNSAVSGGGASGCATEDSIIYYNTASGEQPNYAGGWLNYCCTLPIPSEGEGNITNAPLFADLTGGNLRLQTNSPCINSGSSEGYLYYGDWLDLDRNSRFVGGPMDMGAYEFQYPTSVLPYFWLQLYGLTMDGSADYTDSDYDGHNNWQEWRCRTSPTNALSALRMMSATPTGTNVLVSWQSVAGVAYQLFRSTNLGAQPSFQLLEEYLEGAAGTTVYRDPDAARLAPVFYRVGIWHDWRMSGRQKSVNSED